MSSTAPQTAALLAAAKAGNDASLGRLLQMYAAYLKLLARVQIGRRLQGKLDASDLVQDTFVAAHRSFGLFRGQSEAEFTAWLRQILAAQLANLVRRFVGTKSRDVRMERALEMELEQSSRILDHGLMAPHSSPSQQVVRREMAVRLADALATLPDAYREAIVLRHLEGLPFADVAERMGRSRDSVEKLWLRGLAQLRRAWGDEP